MRDTSWLTAEALRDVFTEYQAKNYNKNPLARKRAQEITDLILHSPEAGRMALEVLAGTPDVTFAALLLITAGVQLGIRLVEIKDGEPWQMSRKTN